MLRILNCVTNEKFIDGLIETCEYTKGHNTHDYVIFSSNQCTNLIKLKEYIKIVPPTQFISFILKGGYNVIVIHSLNSVPFYQLHLIPKKIRVVWFAWGYDIYTFPNLKLPLIKVNLYHDKTKEILFRHLRQRLSVYHSTLVTLFKWNEIKNNINRVDFFSGILPEEYNLINKKKFFNAKQLIFSYFRLHSEIKESNINAPLLEKNDIQVGNSGDPTNNHLDVFCKLRTLGLVNQKIYVPLSYGGSDEYKKEVVKYGRFFFGNNFVPIMKFMPYNEYFNFMSSCSNVILGHERQQAIGNLENGLWRGCKVFLSNTSVAYLHYTGLGYKVYSIQEDLNKENLVHVLPSEDVLDNRRKLIEHSSLDVNIQKMKAIYSILEKDIELQ